MKNAVFALLLANFLMGGWWLWHALQTQAPASNKIALPPVGVERILLLDELTADEAGGSMDREGVSDVAATSAVAGPRQEGNSDASGMESAGDSQGPVEQQIDTGLEAEGNGAASASVAARVPEQPKWACYRFSPSSDSGQIAQLRDELEALEAEKIRSRDEKLSRQSGLWIMIPPARTRAQAQETVSRLESRGFTDYYVVPEGQWKNAISLGLFNDPENAARRLARLKRKGFKAHREVRFEEVPGSLIEAALPVGTVPPTTLDPQALDCADLLAAPAR